MRTLSIMKHVTLDKIWISYDSDNTQYKLNFSCKSDIVYSCSRAVTKKQMESLGLTLYYNSKKFEGYLYNISSNLITFPLICDLVMVNYEIVAIGIDNDNCYCHLQTGTICSKEELFNICKL